MPTWVPSPENTKKSLLLPGTILGFILILWIISLTNILDGSRSSFSTFNFIFFTIFAIYLIGRIYGELNNHKDFITISSDGIQYRETPSLQMGWLPSNRTYSFGQIRSVDMVSAKKLFNPNEETYGILLHFNKGRSQLIGTRLDQKKLMEIAFAMKGSVMLTGSLKRILGEDVTLKDVVDTAKGIWNSFTRKRGENTDG